MNARRRATRGELLSGFGIDREGGRLSINPGRPGRGAATSVVKGGMLLESAGRMPFGVRQSGGAVCDEEDRDVGTSHNGARRP